MKDARLIFIGLWLLYGATIDKADLFNYNLQQSVVEAVVERGTYAIGDSELPQLRDKGDAFLYQGRWLPSKQPGQPSLGAAVYYLCTWFGLTYVKDYFLAAALVTWLTSSLICAMAAACFHLLVTRCWGYARWIGVVSSLALGIGTIIFPYAGIAHHDVIAASLLLMAFCLAERPRGTGWSRFAAGALLGATITTSMLPAVMTAVLAIFLMASGWRSRSGPNTTGVALGAAAIPAGLAAGLLPLAVYNNHYFGNPLVQANIAGNYTETFVSFDGPRLLHHLNAYFGLSEVSLLKYMPIVALGMLGIFLLPPRLSGQRSLLLAMIGLHLAYVLNLPAFGVCQYGPRWLMPVVPFAILGLPAALSFPGRAGPALRWMCAAAGAWSVVVSAAGALCGTMFCETTRFAFLDYLRMLPQLRMQLYPLAPTCLALTGLVVVVVVMLTLMSQRRRAVARTPGRG